MADPTCDCDARGAGVSLQLASPVPITLLQTNHPGTQWPKTMFILLTNVQFGQGSVETALSVPLGVIWVRQKGRAKSSEDLVTPQVPDERPGDSDSWVPVLLASWALHMVFPLHRLQGSQAFFFFLIEMRFT